MNDFNNFWIIFFIVELINFLILWIIVSNATKSERRHSSVQTELLARIAVRHGVPMEEVEEIFRKAGLSSL